MLKYFLDSLDDLDDSQKALYAEKEGGGFQLQVDGVEDTSALKRAKDHEKEARKAAEDKARELSDQLAEIQKKAKEAEDDKARKSGDTEALENSWKEKLANRETELSGQIDSLKGEVQNLLVDSKAAALAAEISSAPNVILPHIKSRMAVEYDESGKPQTRILDANGKPSAATLDDLKSELTAREDFQAIIIGSKASGGGAGAGGSGGGASKIDLSKATPKEKVAYLKSKRGDN